MSVLPPWAFQPGDRGSLLRNRVSLIDALARSKAFGET
jgi:hypothetical protein